MNTTQLVWTAYGNELAIGVRNREVNKDYIEQIYNFFYNYGITNGALYIMCEKKFGYFLIQPKKLKKIKNIRNALGRKISKLLNTDFLREDFLREHNSRNLTEYRWQLS